MITSGLPLTHKIMNNEYLKFSDYLKLYNQILLITIKCAYCIIKKLNKTR